MRRAIGTPRYCIVDGVWSCIALDGGTGWHSARVGDATSLLVLGTEFAEAMEATCRDTVERALLLDATGVVDRGALHRILRTATGVYGRWGAPTRGVAQVEESSRISRGDAP